MWFGLFLWLVFWRLRLRLLWLSFTKPHIFQELAKEAFALQIQTLQNDIVRYFILVDGKLRSKAQPLDSSVNLPSMIVSFTHPKEALEITFALKKEKHLLFNFIQDKKILIEGDFNLIQVAMSIKEKLDQAA